jgi:hypothetical protein
MQHSSMYTQEWLLYPNAMIRSTGARLVYAITRHPFLRVHLRMLHPLIVLQFPIRYLSILYVLHEVYSVNRI